MMLQKSSKIFVFIILVSILFLGVIITMKLPCLLVPNAKEKGVKEILTIQSHREIVLQAGCLQNNLSKPFYKVHPSVAKQLFVEENHKLIYCEVPKVGCSNWKRILLLLKMNLSFNAEYMEHEAIHQTALFKRLIDYPPDQHSKLIDTYTKVMFTRDPLQRIVSAYRDKFLHYGGYYYGTKIANRIRSKFREDKNSTGPVSFQEFVHFIIDQKTTSLDIHWRPMHHLCDPCNIKYDILGKFETLKMDSDYVLKVIGALPSLQYPDIKKYNESRTDTKTSVKYFTQLPVSLLQQLLELYKLDLILFGYT